LVSGGSGGRDVDGDGRCLVSRCNMNEEMLRVYVRTLTEIIMESSKEILRLRKQIAQLEKMKRITWNSLR